MLQIILLRFIKFYYDYVMKINQIEVKSVKLVIKESIYVTREVLSFSQFSPHRSNYVLDKEKLVDAKVFLKKNIVTKYLKVFNEAPFTMLTA